MSTGDPIDVPSTSEYTRVFGHAMNRYKKLTGQDLNIHTLSSKPDKFGSKGAVLDVLRDQMEAFDEFREGNEILMVWLESIVDILFMVSAKLEESTEAPSPPAKAICTAIVVLLNTAKGVDESYASLINFFERIQFCLQRVDSLSETPYTSGIKAILWEIMAEALSTLAVFTKTIKEKGLKKILKGFVRRTDLEDVPRRLNTLTREGTLLAVAGNSEATHSDGNAIATRELVRDVNDLDNITTIQEDEPHTNDQEPAINTLTIDTIKDPVTPEAAAKDGKSGRTPTQGPLRDKLQLWLNPPDPFINHSAACMTRYYGTARWLLQSKTFRSWKKNGSLLWIHGKPGSGKTIICSAIVEDIKISRPASLKSDLMAFYYFDCKDAFKRDIRGLLASLIMQLGDGSNRCRNALSQLYIACDNGSEMPSEAALTRCLKRMLELERRRPIYIVIDAVDECPNDPGMKSARKEVLILVEDLIRSRHPKLYICVTSSLERDIKTTLSLLASTARCLTLHEEPGQKEDIKNYIRGVLKKNKETHLWTSEQQELVIHTLSERADGIFQWVSRRLDVLRGGVLDLILNTPEKLGTSLEETYGRNLQFISEEKHHHALLLFQCLVAAIRPLRVDELTEIFATEFDLNMACNEEDVLSACPSLITVVDERDSKVVQFSSPSVKEFLVSDRLQTLYPGDISRYYIFPEAAHTILSRACIDTLLRLDKSAVQTDLERFPLAFYAAQHWVDHTRFGNVATRNQKFMERLFDPKKSHIEAWIWIHDIEKGQKQTIGTLVPRPSTRSASPLYYASLCGLSLLASWLANMYQEDLSENRGFYGTPLHVASYMGHLETARALIAAGADVNITTGSKTPLHAAFYGRRLDVMRLLLRYGADVDAKDTFQNTLLHQASLDGQVLVVDLLLEHNADTKASNRKGWTPLHRAALCGQFEVAQRLLAKGAGVNTQSLNKNTPLHIGAIAGKFQVVKLLLEHDADVHIRGEHNWTPLEAARANRHHKIAELLSTCGDESRRFKFRKMEVAAMKRRALLVGIAYSTSNKWSPLEGSHRDMDRFRELLITTYGYREQDITVLKDLPGSPEVSQPTRVNVIRELKALVSGAASGDRFIFLYSGHSDQRPSDDVTEEDGMDEMIVTSDEEFIVDSELKEILVPLPVGCSLLAIVDTSHSGTMLDLPHYRCNNIYVPWQSKGKRRTMTMQNINVRRQAVDPTNMISGVPPSLAYMAEGRWPSAQSSNQSLQFGSQLDEASVRQGESSSGGKPLETRRSQVRMLFQSQIRYASPEPIFICDGWCRHNETPHPTVLSISACADPQRAWEGPRGSLTTILCNYLKNHSNPSYGTLMTHINHQLHYNARQLHDYTRHEKKKAVHDQGYGFDGELDNFQEPVLSSLEKLNMEDILLI